MILSDCDELPVVCAEHSRTIFRSFLNFTAPGVLGFALLLAHQFSLQSLGLIDHVHSPDRDPTSLLSANKEGIGSLPGYAALHLLCACLGDVLAAGEGEEDADKRGERAKIPGAEAHSTSRPSQFLSSLSAQHRTTFLWIGSALLQACFLALQRWVQPVSRRACNAAYVAWILALNLQVVLGFAAVLCGRRGGPPIPPTGFASAPPPARASGGWGGWGAPAEAGAPRGRYRPRSRRATTRCWPSSWPPTS